MMRTIGLGLRVGGRELVSGLDWEVAGGQCWCVIGRNGAGKSTLLRTLAGLREPDVGTVQMDTRPLSAWNLHELGRRRAFLPQGRSDAFGYRAIDTVLASRHPWQGSASWESEQDHQAAQAALSKMDVGALAERDVRTLSGGERQRVAIAAVLAQETSMLLLDEPASALDLAHQVGVMKLLGGLCRSEGKSVVLVSHDLNLAHGVASHALLLGGDGSWHAGNVDEVMTVPLLSRFLGHPIEIIEHEKRRIFLPLDDKT